MSCSIHDNWGYQNVFDPCGDLIDTNICGDLQGASSLLILPSCFLSQLFSPMSFLTSFLPLAINLKLKCPLQELPSSILNTSYLSAVLYMLLS